VGTKADAKDWTQANWMHLLRLLAPLHPGIGLVMLGAPDENERSQACLDIWPGPKANFVGTLTVRESAAVLDGAKLFLGHDSGPMHLAASVNTRCIAIFAARNLPGHWYPSGAGHHVFYNHTECFGCNLDRCEVHAKKCILAIKPETVAQVATTMLADIKLSA
jgi:heptosyltransferase III